MNTLSLIITGVAGIVVVGLVLLIISAVRSINHKEKVRKERAILQQILLHGGTVTPIEIAANVEQSFEEVKSVLDRFCESGFGRFEMNEDGTLLYIFEHAKLLSRLNK